MAFLGDLERSVGKSWGGPGGSLGVSVFSFVLRDLWGYMWGFGGVWDAKRAWGFRGVDGSLWVQHQGQRRERAWAPRGCWESLGSFRGPLGGLWEAPGDFWGPAGQWWVYGVFGFLRGGLWGAMGVLGSPQDVDTLYHAGERRCFDLRDFSHLESR